MFGKNKYLKAQNTVQYQYQYQYQYCTVPVLVPIHSGHFEHSKVHKYMYIVRQKSVLFLFFAMFCSYYKNLDNYPECYEIARMKKHNF